LKRLHTDAQRHRFRRQEETQEEKERRRPKDTQRQRSAMPAFEMKNEDVVNIYLGGMDNTCRQLRKRVIVIESITQRVSILA
jgi:hypothetical protein